jgi:hypothetical protein
MSNSEFPKLWGVRREMVLGVWGGSVLFILETYLFWTNYGHKVKYIFW